MQAHVAVVGVRCPPQLDSRVELEPGEIKFLSERDSIFGHLALPATQASERAPSTHRNSKPDRGDTRAMPNDFGPSLGAPVGTQGFYLPTAAASDDG